MVQSFYGRRIAESYSRHTQTRWSPRMPRTQWYRLSWRLPAIQLLATIVIASSAASAVRAADTAVYKNGELPNDSRLQDLKDLRGYFPFRVPEGKAAWMARAEDLRRRILVSTNLWPLPDRTPLNPVLHGKVQRPGFTVEKVYFESFPGHYVTGLLFRPDKPSQGKTRPAVLCPHGHGGRQQDYGEKNMEKLIKSGAERFEKSGRFPKIARCAQLARMGCVVFIFDMLGYEDSTQISYQLAHRYAKTRDDFEGADSWGLYSAQAELRLQSIMGIQTWNSIRCLDFLQQLPDVDPQRLAVTGGSGGGTQTILLCAIDKRPIAAFPNGMVSTSMQGGCTCENCSLLRIGNGNVELAALFAPRPQAMTAANDWTKEMMSKGYPELQKVYEMFGVKDNVYCRPMLHFPHNYNYVTRQTMYAWFNKHMKLGLTEPIEETDYLPLTKAEVRVWDDKHPKPEGGDAYERKLTRQLADISDSQMRKLAPKNQDSLREFKRVVGGAVATMIGRGMPKSDDIQRTKVHKDKQAGYLLFRDLLRYQPKGEELPLISIFPVSTKWNGDVVVWIDDQGKRGLFDGKSQLNASVRRLVDGGAAVVSPDLFQQGEFVGGEVNLSEQRVVKGTRQFAGYTFTYNDTLFARRVHDVLTVVAWVRGDDHMAKRVSLFGSAKTGAIAAAARAVAGDTIDRAAIDTSGFRFAQLKSYRHPDFLPGAVKYGDLPALLALSAPQPLWIGGEDGKIPSLVSQAYQASGAPKQITSSPVQSVEDAAVDWLLQQ